MRWLALVITRWLHNATPTGQHRVAFEVAGLGDANAGLMPQLIAPDRPGVLSVVAIKNGYIIARRVYNPNGPDNIEALCAASIDDLTNLLVAELATQRLTQK